MLIKSSGGCFSILLIVFRQRLQESDKTMKIAISSQGQAISSAVDQRFGRAKYFVVCDTDSTDIAVHDNAQNLQAAQVAGVQAGKNVVDLEVAAVITGNVGPKAFAVLTAGGVDVYTGARGTIAEAIEQFKRGELTKVSGANVDSHWV